MTIDEVSEKLKTQSETGHGSEQLKVLFDGNLLPIHSVGTFAGEDGKDTVVLTLEEGSG